MGLGAAVSRTWERVRGELGREMSAAGKGEVSGERKTSAMPLGLGAPFGAGTVLMPFRSSGMSHSLPKPTAGNLRVWRKRRPPGERSIASRIGWRAWIGGSRRCRG